MEFCRGGGQYKNIAKHYNITILNKNKKINIHIIRKTPYNIAKKHYNNYNNNKQKQQKK